MCLSRSMSWDWTYKSVWEIRVSVSVRLRSSFRDMIRIDDAPHRMNESWVRGLWARRQVQTVAECLRVRQTIRSHSRRCGQSGTRLEWFACAITVRIDESSCWEAARRIGGCGKCCFKCELSVRGSVRAAVHTRGRTSAQCKCKCTCLLLLPPLLLLLLLSSLKSKSTRTHSTRMSANYLRPSRETSAQCSTLPVFDSASASCVALCWVIVITSKYLQKARHRSAARRAIICWLFGQHVHNS